MNTHQITSRLTDLRNLPHDQRKAADVDRALDALDTAVRALEEQTITTSRNRYGFADGFAHKVLTPSEKPQESPPVNEFQPDLLSGVDLFRAQGVKK